MSYALLRFTLMVFVLFPIAASAQPAKLKLSFFSSDRALLYRGYVKPFVDAVNAEGKGLVEIEVFFGGALGKNPAQQAEMVRGGVADIAYVTPGYTADRFPDNSVIELPGLFRDQREASIVFTRLIAANALRGYDDFIVIAAVTVEPHSIHTREPVTSLADLKGLKIRANNPTEARTFEQLGMHGVVMPINQVVDALSNGSLDGAAVPPAMLKEFGIGRLATYHYMIQADAPSLTLLMSRKSFDALPEPARIIIRKHSGDWAVAQANAIFEEINTQSLEQLKSDPKRRVIFPSAADREVIRAAYKQVIDGWLAQDARYPALLNTVEAEIAKVRSGQ
jgi:TRAP-type C4-dicarboxylate transport system substrate-binding protein